MAERPLSKKQIAFIHEYRVDRNATRAYRAAGYAGGDNVCGVEGNKLLKNPKIAKAVELNEKAAHAITEITQARILQELGKIGFSDNRRLYDTNGRIKPIHELDDETAGAISAIEVITRPLRGGKKGEVEQVAKVKFYDKRAALVDLGRHFGMFREQVDVSVSLEAWVMHSLAPAAQPAIDAKQITKE